MKLRTVSLLIIGLIILAACRGSDSDNNSSSDKRDITLRPAPVRTLVEGCPQQELEDWFEVSYFNIQSFIDEAEIQARTADEGRRNEMDTIIDRLQGYRNVVTLAPTPNCVEAVHSEVLDGMEQILNSFQQYANATIGAQELGEQVARDIQPMKDTIDNFIEDTAPLYQVEPSTQVPQ